MSQTIVDRRKSELPVNVLFLTSAVMISLSLISSATLKLKSPAVMASWIQATFLWDVPSYVSYVLAFAEIATVVAILVPRWRLSGFYLSTILSSGFLGVSLARWVYHLKGNCGCYGAFALPPSLQVGVALLIYCLSISNLLFTRKL